MPFSDQPPAGQNRTFQEKFTESIRGFDRFGSLITLTFEGNTKFKTAFGGMLSLISYFIIAGYLMYNFSDVWNKEFSMITTSKVLDVSNGLFDYPLQDRWDVAIQAMYTGPDQYVRDNIDLYFSFYGQQLGSAGFYKGAFSFYSAKDIYFTRCQEGRFGDQNANAEKLGINGYYFCPSTNNITVRGGWDNADMFLWTMSIDYCNQTILDSIAPGQGRVCKTEEETNAVIPYTLVYQYDKKFYFDQYEFNKNPVKFFLDIRHLQLTKGSCNVQFFQMTENQVILKDNSLSRSFGQETLTYLTYDKRKTQDLYFPYTTATKKVGSYMPYGWPILMVGYLQDPNVYIFERNVKSVTDALSSTGGLAGVVNLICLSIGGFIQSALYYRSLSSKLYKVDNRKNGGKKGGKRSKLEMKKYDLDEDDSSRKKLEETQNQSLLQTIKNLTHKMLIQRGFYIAPLKEAIRFETLLTCRMCRRNGNDTHKTYFKARKAITNELDVALVLKKLRTIDAITQVLFNKSQQFVLQKTNEVYLDSKTHSSIQESLAKQSLIRQEESIFQVQLKKFLSKASSKKNQRLLEMLRQKQEVDIDLPILQDSKSSKSSYANTTKLNKGDQTPTQKRSKVKTLQMVKTVSSLFKINDSMKSNQSPKKQTKSKSKFTESNHLPYISDYKSNNNKTREEDISQFNESDQAVAIVEKFEVIPDSGRDTLGGIPNYQKQQTQKLSARRQKDNKNESKERKHSKNRAQSKSYSKYQEQ
eukprot:403344888